MRSILRRCLPGFALLLSLLVSGCGTISNRRPVQVSPLETSLPSSSQKLLVLFEGTLPGQPLAETVWDNASGPFADATESTQIGYTQNYNELSSAVNAGETPAEFGNRPEFSRLIIPFGRIFQETFQSGLKKTFPNSLTTSDSPRESQLLSSPTPAHLVRLKVKEFQFWEDPLNHLNFKATVECRVRPAGVTDQPEQVFEVHREATNQYLGSMRSLPKTLIRQMNKLSNQFAGALAEETLGNLQKKLSE